ncbi:hypothetical protein LTR50_000431 [Elasticomyces elasticus]|nr:hypothetical protein LTR50_000431 [Elasticomyces elasticus]
MGSLGQKIVPDHADVLVIGGGPGGLYTASVLAREGVDTVLLEADVFPRYYIGESMLASMRFFLRFIDLEEKFDSMGFWKKFGATFKISAGKDAAYTDFAVSLGKGGHTWNVVPSQADDLMFRYAGEQGAKIFDGTKVDSIEFEPFKSKKFDEDKNVANPSRAVSAN